MVRIWTASQIRAVADSRQRFTPRLAKWQLRNATGLFTDKKIVGLGDSTTSNATGLFFGTLRFVSYHGVAGGFLEGLQSANIVNQGNNGASLAVFLAGGVPFDMADAIAEAADLYIFSYGINDVRLGATTEAQLVTLLETAIAQLRAGVPNADIVLRIPNSLLTTDVGGHGYVSGITPQAATDRMWNAYKRMGNRWPNVVVWDAQTEVFGRTALASSVYMTDQLHPSAAGYAAIADGLAELIGWQEPFNPQAAYVARTLDSASPWTYYNRSVEDASYFDLVAEGEFVGYGTPTGSSNDFVDFGWPGTRAAQIVRKDLIQMGPANLPVMIPVNGTIAASAANTRISNLGTLFQPNGIVMTAGPVRIWRPKYGDANLEIYLKQKITYPYRRIGYVSSAGNGFIDIAGHLAENKPLAKDWTAVVAADTLLVVGQSPLLLTGFTFAASGNLLRCLHSGDWTAYATGNKRCAITGNHAYE